MGLGITDSILGLLSYFLTLQTYDDSIMHSSKTVTKHLHIQLCVLLQITSSFLVKGVTQNIIKKGRRV